MAVVQPVLRNETEVKLEWVMGIEFPTLPDRDRPVNQQLRMLIEKWRERYPKRWSHRRLDEQYEADGWRSEGFQKQGKGWELKGVDRGVNADMRVRGPSGQLTESSYRVPYEEGKRRPVIDDEVREGLEEIVSVEYDAVPVEELAFDELLDMALQAWYEYGKALELEWYELTEAE